MNDSVETTFSSYESLDGLSERPRIGDVRRKCHDTRQSNGAATEAVNPPLPGG